MLFARCNSKSQAGEAIGAMGIAKGEPILRQHTTDAVREVRETCELALDRLQWLRESKERDDAAAQRDGDKTNGGAAPLHTSVDPAPAIAETRDVSELLALCRDTNKSLFERYRGMFALRDLGTRDAALALCELFADESALLKHEVAFVLGQMQLSYAAPTLRRVLADKNENIMVRHEAAEALGALKMDAHDGTGSADEGDESNDADATLALLRAHANDEEAVVAHSALVALDVAGEGGSEIFFCTLTILYHQNIMLVKISIMLRQRNN